MEVSHSTVPFGKSENNLRLTDAVCFLGFSGGFLSLVFNTLKKYNYKREIKIIKNIEVDDKVPFNCGFDYKIFTSEDYKPKPVDRYLFCVSEPWIKEKIFNHFLEQHNIEKEDYFNLIEQRVSSSETATFDHGIYIEPGCVISPFANLGFGSTINRSVSIGHHSQIGDFVTIHPGAHVAGHCKIGSKTKIGMGSIVFDHTEIGENTIIGGGSIVTKNVQAGVLAYGNPCKVIREL